MKLLTVDLAGIKSKQDIFNKFNEILDFEELPTNWSWFEDSFTSLSTDSRTYKEKMSNEKDIHLIIKNIHKVKNVSEEDYCVLLSVLSGATDKNNRSGAKGDDVNFTFEISNDYDS